MREFGYQTTDEFDLEIANTVETGFVNEQLLIPQAEKLNDQIVATKSENTLREAWRIYHDSFGDDEEILVESIRKSILKHSKYISPSGLNASVKLLRDLDQGELADNLIDQYVLDRKDEKELFDLTNYPFREDISDAKINAEFQKLSDESKEQITLKQVLEKLSNKSGWGAEDERVLAEATPEEYYDLFKNEKGEHLSIYIDKCLQFGRFVNASDTGKTIASNTTKALEKIGQESRLNARRVTKFGVKIPKQ